MLTLMPAYVVFVLIAGLRRSVELAKQVDEASGTDLAASTRSVPWKLCLLWGFFGFDGSASERVLENSAALAV